MHSKREKKYENDCSTYTIHNISDKIVFDRAQTIKKKWDCKPYAIPLNIIRL